MPAGDTPSAARPVIVFTGGGSMGHVSLNLALIPEFRRRGWDPVYIGSEPGPEKAAVGPLGVPYRAVSTGKWRRPFKFKNLADLFGVLRGIWQSFRHLGRLRPRLVFAKGGFVSLPVAVAGWLRRVPVILHESDSSLGLANRLTGKFALRILTVFPEAGARAGRLARKMEHAGFLWPKEDLSSTESPQEESPGSKPILLAVGGSLGAASLNDAVRANLPDLLPHFDVVHICGNGKTDAGMAREGYRQYGFVDGGMIEMARQAAVVVSRAGANAISEFLHLRKPMLLVPLPRRASRGEQYANAEYVRGLGSAEIMEDDDRLAERPRLADAVLRLYQNRHRRRAGTDWEKIRHTDSAGLCETVLRLAGMKALP